MFRWILISLVVIGAILYFPRSRAWVFERARPVLNPVFRWSTNGEMRKISRGLKEDESAYHTIPGGQRDFDLWLQRSFTPDVRTDAWGNPYRFQLRGDSFHLISSGPDGRLGTTDDLNESRKLAPLTRVR